MLSFKVNLFVCKHLGGGVRFIPKRNANEAALANLIGRDLISARDFTCSELKYLLWTASDMKYSRMKKSCQELNLLKGYNATLLLHYPDVKAQLAVANGLRLLGANVSIVNNKRWEGSFNVSDMGRLLSKMSNVIIASANLNESLSSLCNGASVPVINFSSCTYKPLHVLADLLTLQEHYGYLKGLTLGWIGPIGALLNTYLVLFPRFGINIRYACTCLPDLPVSPALLNVSMKYCLQHNTEVIECERPQDAAYRVDIVATTAHDNTLMTITKEITKEAAVNWTFLHDLPRTKTEVTDEIFYSKNSLVWETSSNMSWIAMAVVLQSLKEYHPSIPIPDFYGNYLASKQRYC